MRRYLLIAKRTMISRISLDVPYFAEVTMKLNTPYDSGSSLQANLSNVITVDADISQRTIYWTDTKRIFAYQYASSMSSSSLPKNFGTTSSSSLNSIVSNEQDVKNVQNVNNLNNVYSTHLSQEHASHNQSVPHSRNGKFKTIVSGRKKEQSGRNMTLIWRNVMGKVVNWVKPNWIGSGTGFLANQKSKQKSAKSKAKEKAIRNQKSRLMNSGKHSKSAFGPGSVRTVHRVGIVDVNGLAVDVLGRKLYWSDAVRKRIEVSQLNGKQRKILIYRDLDR